MFFYYYQKLVFLKKYIIFGAFSFFLKITSGSTDCFILFQILYLPIVLDERKLMIRFLKIIDLSYSTHFP